MSERPMSDMMKGKPEVFFGGDQEESIGSCSPNYNPQRETAASRIKRILDDRRKQVVALEQLLKIANQVEVGSPLEELLWCLCTDQNLRG